METTKMLIVRGAWGAERVESEGGQYHGRDYREV